MFTKDAVSKSKLIVSNARQAREERAEQKQHESAVITIQAIARGFLCRHSLSQKWREELDLLIDRKPVFIEDNIISKSFEKEHSISSSSTIPLDKIPAHIKQLSQEEWQFASFGSNTLTGAYGNFGNSQKSPMLSNSKNPYQHHKSDKKIDEQLIISMDNCKSSVTSAKLKNLTKLKNQSDKHQSSIVTKHNKPSNQDLFKAINKFLFFFKPIKDQERFYDLSRYLLNNAEKELSSKFAYVNLCIHKQYVLPWISQVKVLLWECCKYLDIKQSGINQYIVEVCLSMLDMFTDETKWLSLQKQTALLGALGQICLSIKTELCNKGALCVLTTLLKNGLASSLNNDLVALCINLIFRIIPSKELSDDQVILIALSVLTIPGLIQHLQEKVPQCLPFFKKNNLLLRVVLLLHVEGACVKHIFMPKSHVSCKQVTDVLCLFANMSHLCLIEIDTVEKIRVEILVLLNELLKFLQINTIAAKGSSNTWHPILGYFSGNEPKNIQIEFMPLVKQQLEYLWTNSLVRIFFHDLLSLPSLHDDNVTPVQAEQISIKKKEKTKFSDKLGFYFKKLSSSRSRKILLPTGGRKLDYSEVKNTCSSCMMYKRTLSILTKQIQLEMLTGLSFDGDILCRLWRFICELGSSGGFNLFLSALSFPPAMSEPYFAVFTLFCDMTSHILTILDDVEFYEQQIPFHLEELVIISGALRDFVFKMIWGGIMGELSSGMYSVFDSAHTLLMMLYDRDSRRSFTPLNHWLCREIKASTIRNECEKSLPRAKLLLQKIPFVLPHKERVVLFRNFVTKDKEILDINPDSEVQQHIRVHRSRLVDDGYSQLALLSNKMLKGVIRVRFVNDLGLDEAGIDQDGVFKEFLEEITKKVFNPDMNLFKMTSGVEPKLYPSPLSYIEEEYLSLFTFVGKMLGKAVYEGIVLDIPFANFFLRNLLGQQHSILYSPIDELPSLDAEFYKNLTWIKRYNGDISDLGLNFTYEENVMGSVQSHELIPGGSAIAVTNDNRFLYVHTLAHYRLHTQIKNQTQAFIAGFRSLISSSWTSMFSAPELQRLISGDNVGVDLTDLRRHVVYYGGFHSSHKVIKWLWDILERDYTADQRASFLKFVTSCSRPPLLGFAHLNPQFSIRCVEVPDEEDTGDTVAGVLKGFFRVSSSRRSHGHSYRLPTASTCFNLLKLPNYPTKDVLREKLKQALSSNTGFELS